MTTISVSHYWAAATVQAHKDAGCEGVPFAHTAGNQFGHIRPYDDVYAISRDLNGDMLLIGRLTATTVRERLSVGGPDRAIFTPREAEQALGVTDLWEAEHHLIGVRDQRDTVMSFRRVISAQDAVENLRFVQPSTGRLLAPKLEAIGVLDRQTLRGVRQLAPEAAAWLDSVFSIDDVIFPYEPQEALS